MEIAHDKNSFIANRRNEVDATTDATTDGVIVYLYRKRKTELGGDVREDFIVPKKGD